MLTARRIAGRSMRVACLPIRWLGWGVMFGGAVIHHLSDLLHDAGLRMER